MFSCRSVGPQATVRSEDENEDYLRPLYVGHLESGSAAYAGKVFIGLKCVCTRAHRLCMTT